MRDSNDELWLNQLVLKLFTKVKGSGPLETIIKINNDERIEKKTSREMKQRKIFPNIRK